MATTYRYKFDGFSEQTLISAVDSMGLSGVGLAVVSAPSSVFIDIDIPDGLDPTVLDAVVAYPYKFTRVGVAVTPNVRVASVRVKRNAAFSVSSTPTQVAWDAYSTLVPSNHLSLASGDLVSAVSGLMRIDAQAIVTSLLGLASLTMRVIVNPGASQVVVCTSPPMGATSAACNVQFAIAAGVPVRIEVEKSGGVGNATLVLTEDSTFCCANVIAA
jgi:hypothetical protein